MTVLVLRLMKAFQAPIVTTSPSIDLGPTERFVLLAIANFDGLDDFRPSQPKLATVTGYTERTVRRAVERLCEERWICAFVKPGMPHTYRVNAARIEAIAEQVEADITALGKRRRTGVTPDRLSGVTPAEPRIVCPPTPDTGSAHPGSSVRGTPDTGSAQGSILVPEGSSKVRAAQEEPSPETATRPSAVRLVESRELTPTERAVLACMAQSRKLTRLATEDFVRHLVGEAKRKDLDDEDILLALEQADGKEAAQQAGAAPRPHHALIAFVHGCVGRMQRGDAQRARTRGDDAAPRVNPLPDDLTAPPRRLLGRRTA